MTLTSTTSSTILDKGSPFWHKLEDPTCTKDKQEEGAQNRSVLKLAAQMELSKQMVSTIMQSCNKTRIKVCSNPSFQNCMQNCKPSNTHPSELKKFAQCGSFSAETLSCGFFWDQRLQKHPVVSRQVSASGQQGYMAHRGMRFIQKWWWWYLSEARNDAIHCNYNVPVCAKFHGSVLVWTGRKSL